MFSPNCEDVTITILLTVTDDSFITLSLVSSYMRFLCKSHGLWSRILKWNSSQLTNSPLFYSKSKREMTTSIRELVPMNYGGHKRIFTLFNDVRCGECHKYPRPTTPDTLLWKIHYGLFSDMREYLPLFVQDNPNYFAQKGIITTHEVIIPTKLAQKEILLDVLLHNTQHNIYDFLYIVDNYHPHYQNIDYTIDMRNAWGLSIAQQEDSIYHKLLCGAAVYANDLETVKQCIANPKMFSLGYKVLSASISLDMYKLFEHETHKGSILPLEEVFTYDTSLINMDTINCLIYSYRFDLAEIMIVLYIHMKHGIKIVPGKELIFGPIFKSKKYYYQSPSFIDTLPLFNPKPSEYFQSIDRQAFRADWSYLLRMVCQSNRIGTVIWFKNFMPSNLFSYETLLEYCYESPEKFDKEFVLWIVDHCDREKVLEITKSKHPLTHFILTRK